MAALAREALALSMMERKLALPILAARADAAAGACSLVTR